MSTPRPNQHPNRESWLNDVAGRLRPAFAQLGTPLPDRLRIAIGFPSAGRRAKAAGECWDSSASADGTFEILVRPDLADANEGLALPVAAALVHELVHAAVGIQAGKGPAFRKIILGLGLTGPMRATSPGPAFHALIAPLLDAVGPLPHARLRTDRKPVHTDQTTTDAPLTTRARPQANRHIKCTCTTCGYLVRTARKWLDQLGPPLCPQHGAMQPEEHDSALNGIAPVSPDFTLIPPE